MRCDKRFPSQKHLCYKLHKFSDADAQLHIESNRVTMCLNDVEQIMR